ncbi:MAG TPA: type II secretion system F family protein [Acetobacteraceae bacterium]|nr:type II secretion system F family protein [Acetobacteraceae bacterium]
MNPHAMRWLSWSLLLLAGLGFAAWLLVRMQAREQKFRTRLAAAVSPHHRARTPDADTAASPWRGSPTPWAVLCRRAALGFGFDPLRADQYPLRWWIGISACLLPARAIGGFLAAILGPLALVAVLPIWIVLSRSLFHLFDHRRALRLFTQMPDALATIVRAVRVGIPVADGLRMVARDLPEPTAAEFSRLSSQIAIGMPPDEALRAMALRNGLQEYRFFATALALQAQTGGGLTETLETLADVIRKRVALRARGHALASEARTSVIILLSLPFFAGGALALLNPHYIAVLFFTPGGRRLLGIAILSLGMGMLVMRSIIQRSLS